MSRQYWEELLATVVSDGTPVANTTSETIIFPDVTVPGNYMQDGRTVRLRAFGKLSVTGTPTITFKVRWGGVAGTLLATTEAITNGSGLTTVNWELEVYIVTRSNGSAGSLLVFGTCQVQTNASGDPTVKSNTFSVSGSDAPAAVGSLDLTTDKALSLTATWSAASASNTLTGMLYTVESLN